MKIPRIATRSVSVAMAAVGALLAGTAHADIYYNTCNESSRLCSFDTVTGTSTAGPLFSGGSSYGIAIASNGSAYSLLNSTRTLATLNLATGALTQVGAGDASFFGYGLDFASNGTLYAIGVNDNNIYTVNTVTGVFSAGASLSGISGVMDFTFDPFDNLYAVASTNDIYRINSLTGVASFAFSGTVGSLMSIAADNAGNLVAVGYGDNRFETIRVSDGSVLSVTSLPGANANYHGGDILINAQVPEPGTMALTGLALAGLAAMRRRKN